MVHRSPYPRRAWTRWVWLIWMTLMTVAVCGIAMVLALVAGASLVVLFSGWLVAYR